jgi:hypothetical protein
VIYLSVDLAAKYSAACVLDENGKVHWEGNSGEWASVGWAKVLVGIAQIFKVDLIIVEDVPYGISSQKMVKDILRLQGMLIAELWREACLEKTLWVNPSTWQKRYPGVSRGKPEERIEAARAAAAQLDYYAPNLVQKYLDTVPEGKRPLQKFIKPLEKQMTDHIDAFLMGNWAHELGEEAMRKLSTVQSAVV